MNNLSWLIYAADVLPALGRWFGITAVILASVSGFSLIAVTIEDVWEDHKAWFFKVWISLSFLIIFSALCPSKETIYLIAASEIGENVIETPEFVKIRTMINTWLDENGGLDAADLEEPKKD